MTSRHGNGLVSLVLQTMLVSAPTPNVAIYFSWLLALSTARPLTPRKGFATAQHALIIGCNGFGKKQLYAVCSRRYQLVDYLYTQEECT